MEPSDQSDTRISYVKIQGDKVEAVTCMERTFQFRIEEHYARRSLVNAYALQKGHYGLRFGSTRRRSFLISLAKTPWI